MKYGKKKTIHIEYINFHRKIKQSFFSLEKKKSCRVHVKKCCMKKKIALSQFLVRYLSSPIVLYVHFESKSDCTSQWKWLPDCENGRHRYNATMLHADEYDSLSVTGEITNSFFVHVRIHVHGECSLCLSFLPHARVNRWFVPHSVHLLYMTLIV